MSFTDHKITQFQHRIVDLPDQPTLPPDELKSRFDACPEELRQSLNAVCDDAARLEARVEGIVVDTFGDSIDKSMLSDELRDELDAKATQTALAAEAAAREAADSSLRTQLNTQAQTLNTKCRVYIGHYTGNGASERIISLGFTPLAVLVIEQGYELMRGHGGLVLPDRALTGQYGDECLKIVDDGFWVNGNYSRDCRTNMENTVYHYLAFSV